MKKLFSLLLICSIVMSTFVTVMAEEVTVFSLDFETTMAITKSGKNNSITYDNVKLTNNKNASGIYSNIIEYSAGTGVDGSQSLKLQAPAYGYANVSYNVSNLEVGGIYKFSAAVKLDATATKAKATNMSTITDGVYYVKRDANGNVDSLVNRCGASVSATAGGVEGITLNSDSYTTITKEFYVSETAPATVKFTLSGLGSNADKDVYYYVDNVSLTKVGKLNASIAGADSIDIPAYEAQDNTSEYSIKYIGPNDDDYTKALTDANLISTPLTLKLDGVYEDVVLEGNVLKVKDIAYDRNIKILAVTTGDVTVDEHTVHINYPGQDTKPQARGVELQGTVKANATLTVTFTYYDPYGEDLKTGGVEVSWFGKHEGQTTWTPITQATEYEALGGNKYKATYSIGSEGPQFPIMMCEVTVTNAQDESSDPEPSNEMQGPVKPEIKEEITFTGNSSEGNAFKDEEITPFYVWDDKNGDAEAASIHAWYRLDSVDENYENLVPIIATETGTVELPLKYTPSNDDIDKYLQFVVTPVSEGEDETTGSPKASPILVGPRRPTASDVKVVLSHGYTYEASYAYDHEQDVPEDEGATIIKWFDAETDEELPSPSAPQPDGFPYPQYYTFEAGTVKDVYIKVTPFAQVAPHAETPETSKVYTIDTTEPINLFESWGNFEQEGVKDTVEGSEKIKSIDQIINATNTNRSWIVGYSDEEKFSGQKSLELCQSNESGYSPVVFNAADLEAGGLYKVSVRVKLKEETAGMRRTAKTNWRTTTSDVYYIEKNKNNTIKTLAVRWKDLTAPDTGNVSPTTISSDEWTLLETEFIIPSSTTANKTVNFALSGALKNYYIDDIKLQKYDSLHFEYDGLRSIEIPKVDEQPTSVEYSAKLVAGGLDFTKAMGVEPVFSLKESDAHDEGVSFDPDKNILTIDKKAHTDANDELADVTLVVNTAATEKNGAYEEECPINLTYTGDLNPQVRDLTIKGNVKGSGDIVIEPGYYYDPKNTPKATETIRWEGKIGEGTFGTIPGSDNLLSLPAGLHSAYDFVKCFITVTNGVLSSQEAESNVLEVAAAPEILDVTFSGISLEGNVLMGETVEAIEDWYDVNKDNKVDSDYQWYRLDSENATPVEITGATSKEYEPVEADVDKILMVKITPNSDDPEGPAQGEPFTKTIIGPQTPEAQNVSITKEGSVLTANYDYVHSQNIKEGQTKFEWYLNGELKSTASQYTVPSNTTGSVYVKVTPVAEKAPTTGTSMTSSSVSVNTVSDSSDGGNGTSSAPSSIFGNAGGGKPSQNGAIVGGADVTVNDSSAGVQGSNSGFSDVQNHWAKDCIEELVAAGILKGVSENSFAPDSKVNRAEFCTMIYRALGLTSAGGGQKFGDVSADKWYYESVQAVAEKGIINGDGQNFNPENQMTRQEMAKVIWGAISDKVPTPSVDAVSYSDSADISDWAKNAINSLSFYKILEGSDGQFRPVANMTRAEAAAVISRVLKLINGGK